MKVFIYKKICPLVCELGKAFLGKSKQEEKEKFRPFLNKFKLDIEETINLTGDAQCIRATLPHSSSNESISEDI
jgi:hypothetical protein